MIDWGTVQFVPRLPHNISWDQLQHNYDPLSDADIAKGICVYTLM